MKTRIAALTFAVVCLLAWGCAHAAITCTPTNNSIVFGAYDPLGGAVLDGTGSFAITCLDVNGPGAGTTLNWTATLSGAGTRQLAPPSGSDRLNYEIYTDTNRSAVWSTGTGTSVFTGTLSVAKNSSVTTGAITYYGRITGNQDVSAASPGPSSTTYSKALTITVTCVKSNGQAMTC